MTYPFTALLLPFCCKIKAMKHMAETREEKEGWKVWGGHSWCLCMMLLRGHSIDPTLKHFVTVVQYHMLPLLNELLFTRQHHSNDMLENTICFNLYTMNWEFVPCAHIPGFINHQSSCPHGQPHSYRKHNKYLHEVIRFLYQMSFSLYET